MSSEQISHCRDFGESPLHYEALRVTSHLYNTVEDDRTRLYGEEETVEYNDEEAEGGENGADNDEKHPFRNKKYGPWVLWLRLWATPQAAWKLMRQQRLSPSLMESAVFYPLVALASAGSFARKFYLPETTLSSCLIEATCIFVAFFAAYFMVIPLSRLLMRRDCAKKVDTPFGRCYAASLMSTLALFLFLYESLPHLQELIAFTPAYTVYLSFKGKSEFKVPQQRSISTWVALLLLITLLPVLLYELLGIMLPANIEPR